MPTLFLHAGAPKTGTSYLQVLFAKYAAELADSGIIYPKGHLFNEARSGQITSGNGVAMANYIRPHLPHQIPNKETFIYDLDEELTRSKGKDVLYSSEFLSFDAGEATAAIARVAELRGYEIRVIYLVRDIALAAFSTYSQQIKNHGETRSFAEYIRDWDPYYRLEIKKAVDAFGFDSPIVYNFEENRDKLAELIFRDVLGVSFIPNERAQINRSLTPNEAEMVRLMNTAYPKNNKFSGFVASALMGIEVSNEPFSVTQEEADFLDRRFNSAVNYVNGFVRGQPIIVARNITDRREVIKISDFERSIIAIVAKLVTVVAK